MNVKPIFEPDLSVDQTNYYWFKEGFSSEEIDQINTLSDSYPLERATIVVITRMMSVKVTLSGFTPMNLQNGFMIV